MDIQSSAERKEASMEQNNSSGVVSMSLETKVDPVLERHRFVIGQLLLHGDVSPERIGELVELYEKRKKELGE